MNRLAKVNEKVKDKLMIIPRIYTNKPRTTGEGYKGMLHQPDPDKAPDLYAGIIAIRHMHIRAMEESGLKPDGVRCYIRRTEAIWMIFYLMRQSVHVLWKIGSIV